MSLCICSGKSEGPASKSDMDGVEDVIMGTVGPSESFGTLGRSSTLTDHDGMGPGASTREDLSTGVRIFKPALCHTSSESWTRGGHTLARVPCGGESGPQARQHCRHIQMGLRLLSVTE
eukprot:CAMPEP_0169445504 /NCGR_PEP_ID=MMETSP1042-20121227/10475_1 /TAXON_ID=464988 /ORGANISM="Hemiselmis andersenii, Strain CCMP1180" /LENGTH=118 /DNA_ID=CAMNT_0009556905 /DNA_START=958 /DNA_END=1314 /DNA_ORIENTATION=+